MQLPSSCARDTGPEGDHGFAHDPADPILPCMLCFVREVETCAPCVGKGHLGQGLRCGARHFDPHLPHTCFVILGKHLILLSLHLPACNRVLLIPFRGASGWSEPAPEVHAVTVIVLSFSQRWLLLEGLGDAISESLPRPRGCGDPCPALMETKSQTTELE